MTYKIYRDDELYHHGVDGQKWGRRRYQNEDGSYKPGAEGRYDPDGQPGSNTGKRSASSNKDEPANVRIAKKIGKSKIVGKGTLVDKVGSKIAWDIVKQNQRRRKKAAEKEAKNRQRAEYAEKKHQERQVKRDEKASKDSYKKVALRYAGRKLAGGLIGAAVGNAVAKKTGNYELGTKAARAVGLGTSAYNGYKTFSDARNIYNYRKRKSAKHSDILEYDALYHGENGVMYGIRYA